jgi:monofunctional biosynthetic peptidoglycan transglycosylase
MQAIRKALDDGANRGASTISQQTAKNVFLWQGRSWFRKALESGLTPVVEMFWTKKRIIEVYLNVAEMGPGVFGIEAAAQHWFGVSARDLTARQAARIAAALPDPKDRNPARPSAFLRGRANEIRAGAETILADGRSACFED